MVFILHFVYPLSVDEHLSCFPFFAIMNNAAVNICLHIFVWICVCVFVSLLGIYVGVELLLGVF